MTHEKGLTAHEKVLSTHDLFRNPKKMKKVLFFNFFSVSLNNILIFIYILVENLIIYKNNLTKIIIVKYGY